MDFPESDLIVRLGHNERDNVEWKRSFDDRDAIRRSICALANDLPRRGEGHLLIGVNNDGTPSHLSIDDQLILRIANIRDEARILPRPVLSVDRALFAGIECIYVRVDSSRSLPVHFDGSAYVRVGTSTRRAHREEEQLLIERRRATDLFFDQRPVAGTSVADLDRELFLSTYLPAAIDRDVLLENHRPYELQLASLAMLDTALDEATVIGLLVIGLDPSAWIRGAYVQFVRYEGADAASNVVDHVELRSNVVGQLDELGRLLPANIRTAIGNLEGLRQPDRPDYPILALRELVVNAVVHRDYEMFNAPIRILWFDDRVELASPGGPFGVVTRDTFDRRNDYRNPALAGAMKYLGYVNRFGRGITLVRRLLEDNGNPPPEFNIEDTYWSVTVRSAR